LRYAVAHDRDSLLEFSHKPLSTEVLSGGFAHARHVVQDIGEAIWSERHDVRFFGESFSGAGDFIVINGTNVAQSLGQDDVRRALGQALFVYHVKTLVAPEPLADPAIDLKAGHSV